MAHEVLSLAAFPQVPLPAFAASFQGLSFWQYEVNCCRATQPSVACVGAGSGRK